MGKIILIYILIPFLFIMAFSCSREEEELLPLDSTQSIFSQTLEGIQMEFYLTDEHGVNKVVFCKGEDIIFNVDITNIGETWIDPGTFYDGFYDQDFFHVYSIDGTDYGIPWAPRSSDTDIDASYAPFIPGMTHHYQVSWYGNEQMFSGSDYKPLKKTPKLSSGNYFVIAPIYYLSRKMKSQATLRIDFQIKNR